MEEDIRNSIALMADESTTVSVTKELIIYSWCVIDGNLSSHFLKVLKLEGQTQLLQHSQPTWMSWKFHFPMFTALVVMVQL